MAVQHNTTKSLDFTHLYSKPCTTESACNSSSSRRRDFPGDDSLDKVLSITKLIHSTEEFSKFSFLLKMSGLEDKFDKFGPYTMSIVPDICFPESFSLISVHPTRARDLILQHVIQVGIKPCDLDNDIKWMYNGNNLLFYLSRNYWNNSKITSYIECNNGYVFIVDKLCF